jgi:hypothetical protein
MSSASYVGRIALAHDGSCLPVASTSPSSISSASSKLCSDARPLGGGGGGGALRRGDEPSSALVAVRGRGVDATACLGCRFSSSSKSAFRSDVGLSL